MKAVVLEKWLPTLTGSRQHPVVSYLMQADEFIEACYFFAKRIVRKLLLFIRWGLSLFETESPKTIIPSLLEELTQARRDFLWAQNYYNSVTDKNLLDFAMYQMLASQSKYTYFLKRIRAEGITNGSAGYYFQPLQERPYL